MKKNGKKKHRPRPRKTDAEKRKLMLLRQATTAAASKYNIGGREKQNRRQPTMPSADELKRFTIDEDDEQGEDEMAPGELEGLVREWRDAQKAIDELTVEERRDDLKPLQRMVAAHNALVKYVDEELG
jgi:hypothetical protein